MEIYSCLTFCERNKKKKNSFQQTHIPHVLWGFLIFYTVFVVNIYYDKTEYKSIFALIVVYTVLRFLIMSSICVGIATDQVPWNQSTNVRIHLAYLKRHFNLHSNDYTLILYVLECNHQQMILLLIKLLLIRILNSFRIKSKFKI